VLNRFRNLLVIRKVKYVIIWQAFYPANETVNFSID
jgi:hypothetical protein